MVSKTNCKNKSTKKYISKLEIKMTSIQCDFFIEFDVIKKMLSLCTENVTILLIKYLLRIVLGYIRVQIQAIYQAGAMGR